MKLSLSDLRYIARHIGIEVRRECWQSAKNGEMITYETSMAVAEKELLARLATTHGFDPEIEVEQ